MLMFTVIQSARSTCLPNLSDLLFAQRVQWYTEPLFIETCESVCCLVARANYHSGNRTHLHGYNLS